MKGGSSLDRDTEWAFTVVRVLERLQPLCIVNATVVDKFMTRSCVGNRVERTEGDGGQKWQRQYMQVLIHQPDSEGMQKSFIVIS